MIEAMKQALEALEFIDQALPWPAGQAAKEAITSLRQAIEDAENQKPVAVILEDMKGGGYIEWLDDTYFVPGTKFYTQPQQAEKVEPVGSYDRENQDFSRVQRVGWEPIYTTPQQREFVGLTDEEIFETHKQVDSMQYLTFGKAIEAKLKEKNT